MTRCKQCGDPLTRDRGEWIDPTDGDVCSLASGDAGHNLPHAPLEGYVVAENTPGYLPDTNPTTVDTFGEALDVAEDCIAGAAEYLQGGDPTVEILVDRFRNMDTIGGECFAAYVRTRDSHCLGRWVSIDPAADFGPYGDGERRRNA